MTKKILDEIVEILSSNNRLISIQNTIASLDSEKLSAQQLQLLKQVAQHSLNYVNGLGTTSDYTFLSEKVKELLGVDLSNAMMELIKAESRKPKPVYRIKLGSYTPVRSINKVSGAVASRKISVIKSKKNNEYAQIIPCISFMAFNTAASGGIVDFLSPKNSVPKSLIYKRGEKDFVFLSKINNQFDQRIGQLALSRSATELGHDPFYTLGIHMGVGLITGESDLKFDNLDIAHNIRIDFGCTFADFIHSNINDFADISYFTRRLHKGSFFPINKVDLAVFPILTIAAPHNWINTTRTEPHHVMMLSKLSSHTAFVEGAHQSFLKSLLLSKDIIDPILAGYIPDTGSLLAKFSDHINTRIKELKIALVQVEKFRENILNDQVFAKFKAAIIQDFRDYNAKNIKDHDRKDPDKQSYYKTLKINIEEMESKLDGIRKTVEDCDLVAKGQLPVNNNKIDQFQRIFLKEFDASNAFHRYAMQVILATDDENFNAEDLCAYISKQTNIHVDHMLDYMDLPFEGFWHNRITNICKNVEDFASLQKAEILFYVNDEIDDMLIKRSQGHPDGSLFNTQRVIDFARFYAKQEYSNSRLWCFYAENIIESMRFEQIRLALDVLSKQKKSDELLRQILLALDRISSQVNGEDLILLKNIALRCLVVFHNPDFATDDIYALLKLANEVEAKDNFRWGKLACLLIVSCILLTLYTFITAPLFAPLGLAVLVGFLLAGVLSLLGVRLYEASCQEQETQTNLWSPLYGALTDKIQQVTVAQMHSSNFLDVSPN